MTDFKNKLHQEKADALESLMEMLGVNDAADAELYTKRLENCAEFEAGFYKGLEYALMLSQNN